MASMVAALVAAAVSLSAPAAAETGVSNARTYSVAMTSIDGATTDRMGSWNARIAELSEGDRAVVAAFNHASRTSAQGQIDRAEIECNPGEQ
jgi:hypothetical protein